VITDSHPFSPLPPSLGGDGVIPDELLFSPTPNHGWRWQDFESLYPHFQCLVARSLTILHEASFKEAVLALDTLKQFVDHPNQERFASYRAKLRTPIAIEAAIKKAEENQGIAQAVYDGYYAIADLFRGADGSHYLFFYIFSDPC